MQFVHEEETFTVAALVKGTFLFTGEDIDTVEQSLVLQGNDTLPQAMVDRALRWATGAPVVLLSNSSNMLTIAIDKIEGIGEGRIFKVLLAGHFGGHLIDVNLVLGEAMETFEVHKNLVVLHRHNGFYFGLAEWLLKEPGNTHIVFPL